MHRAGFRNMISSCFPQFRPGAELAARAAAVRWGGHGCGGSGKTGNLGYPACPSGPAHTQAKARVTSDRQMMKMRILIPITIVSLFCSNAAFGRDWPSYGGNSEGTRYSPLKQMTRANVKRLEVAWTYDTA